jgi:hypothetical protein
MEHRPLALPAAFLRPACLILYLTKHPSDTYHSDHGWYTLWRSSTRQIDYLKNEYWMDKYMINLAGRQGDWQKYIEKDVEVVAYIVALS